MLDKGTIRYRSPRFPSEYSQDVCFPSIVYCNIEITWSDIQDYVNGNMKIAVMKIVRELTNWQLRDVKAWVDVIFDRPDTSKAFDLYYALRDILGLPLDPQRSLMSKADLMSIISDVLDHAEPLYFQDPLDCLEVWINNVRKQGGLNTIYQKMYRVVDSL